MYRYELHMHSLEGSLCGKSTIHDMISSYKDMGFTGAVVTNHFTRGNCRPSKALGWPEYLQSYCRAYYQGRETAAALDFDLLFGVEQGYGGGKEFLAYGFEPDFLYARPQLRTAGIEAWVKAVHEVGGFIAYAHPFRQRSYIPDPRTMPDLALADGVEIYNFCNLPEDNALAQQVFSNADTVCIVGSDLHKAGFTTCCGVDLPRRVRTSAELSAVLKENNFQLWLGDR